MSAKVVEPSVKETAFNCPHCGSLTTQYWYRGLAAPLDKGKKPTVLTSEDVEETDLSHVKDDEVKERLMETFRRMAKGLPYFGDPDTVYNARAIYNLYISNCFNCGELSIWIYDRLLWPAHQRKIVAADDMPSDVRADFEEAATIHDASPRGAAALLRLAIQKLCVDLGGYGKNINDDIAALVANGLDIRIQQALDVVRVIGNNAVHPGHIDLKDDTATVIQLFQMVNLIVDVMITQPKHIGAMFAGLGPGPLAAIAKRDAPKQ